VDPEVAPSRHQGDTVQRARDVLSDDAGAVQPEDQEPLGVAPLDVSGLDENLLDLEDLAAEPAAKPGAKPSARPPAKVDAALEDRRRQLRDRLRTLRQGVTHRRESEQKLIRQLDDQGARYNRLVAESDFITRHVRELDQAMRELGDAGDHLSRLDGVIRFLEGFVSGDPAGNEVAFEKALRNSEQSLITAKGLSTEAGRHIVAANTIIAQLERELAAEKRSPPVAPRRAPPPPEAEPRPIDTQDAEALVNSARINQRRCNRRCIVVIGRAAALDTQIDTVPDGDARKDQADNELQLARQSINQANSFIADARRIADALDPTALDLQQSIAVLEVDLSQASHLLDAAERHIQTGERALGGVSAPPSAPSLRGTPPSAGEPLQIKTHSKLRLGWEKKCAKNKFWRGVDTWGRVVLPAALYSPVKTLLMFIPPSATQSVVTHLGSMAAEAAVQTGVARRVPYLGAPLKWVRGEVSTAWRDRLEQDFNDRLSVECSKAGERGEVDAASKNIELQEKMSNSLGEDVDDFASLDEFFLEKGFIDLVAERAKCLPHQVPPLGDDVRVYERYCYTKFTETLEELAKHPEQLKDKKQKDALKLYHIKQNDAETPHREGREAVLQGCMNAARRYAKVLFDRHQEKAWRVRTAMGITTSVALSAALGPFYAVKGLPVLVSVGTAVAQKALRRAKKPKGLKFGPDGKPIVSVRGMTDMGSGGFFDPAVIKKADPEAKSDDPEDAHVLQLVKKLDKKAVDDAKKNRELKSREEMALALELPLRAALLGKPVCKPAAAGTVLPARTTLDAAEDAFDNAKLKLNEENGRDGGPRPNNVQVLTELRNRAEAKRDAARAAYLIAEKLTEMTFDAELVQGHADGDNADAKEKVISRVRKVWAEEVARMWDGVNKNRKGSKRHQFMEWTKHGSIVTAGGAAAAGALTWFANDFALTSLLKVANVSMTAAALLAFWVAITPMCQRIPGGLKGLQWLKTITTPVQAVMSLFGDGGGDEKKKEK
jgi:hypothetical protein